MSVRIESSNFYHLKSNGSGNKRKRSNFFKVRLLLTATVGLFIWTVIAADILFPSFLLENKDNIGLDITYTNTKQSKKTKIPFSFIFLISWSSYDFFIEDNSMVVNETFVETNSKRFWGLIRTFLRSKRIQFEMWIHNFETECFVSDSFLLDFLF